MFKIPPGPVAYFDVDDTLLMWDMPKVSREDEIISVTCRGREQKRHINVFNLDLLIKMAQSGHAIVVWSAGGSDWAEAAVKALNIEQYVDVVTAKPTYYIDDVADPKKIIGKHGYFDINGKRADTDHYAHKEESFESPGK